MPGCRRHGVDRDVPRAGRCASGDAGRAGAGAVAARLAGLWHPRSDLLGRGVRGFHRGVFHAGDVMLPEITFDPRE